MKLTSGIIIGLGVAVAIIFIVESIGHALFPAPAGLVLSSVSGIHVGEEGLPLGMQITDVLAWTLGIFGGGLVGGIVAGRRAIISWIVAPIILCLAALSFGRLPYEEWLVQAALGLIFVAAGLASYYARELPNLR
ncbi:MAG: hypothetical protein AAF683_04730 [Pseudomonadota bacterium]